MKHFTIAEFTNSATARKEGIDNTPTAEHVRNIETFTDNILDPLREAWAVRCAEERWGTPALRISSGYRGFRLNEQVKGAATSAHCLGFAADIVPVNGRRAEFKKFCREWIKGRAFDQLISEDEDTAGVPAWMHVGYKNQQSGQRRQMLSKRAGSKTYTTMTR